MLELARFFGNGDMRQGFVQVASVYALLSSVMMVVIFLTTSNEVSNIKPPNGHKSANVFFPAP